MKHTSCPHCGKAVQAAELVHTRTTKNRGPAEKPGPGRNGRARMWQSMRAMPSFTVVDVVATAEVPRNTAFTYVSTLVKFGFLRVLKESTGEAGDFTVYKLIRNYGPHYPRQRTDGTLFEPNRLEIVHAA